jgi:hypothetical protein
MMDLYQRPERSESNTIFRSKWFLKWGFVSYLLLSLMACASSAAPSQSSTPQVHPTPTLTLPTLPPGTLLYQADWSHGLANWQASSGWSVNVGYLQSESNGDHAISAPYLPTVSDYAVEVHIKILTLLSDAGYFTIAADKATGKDGYQAGILGLRKPRAQPFGAHPQCQVFIDPVASMEPGSVEAHDYEPGFIWHTYRIEVQGPLVSFFIDDQQVSSAASTQTSVLSNGPIRLTSMNAQLEVSSFRVTAL